MARLKVLPMAECHLDALAKLEQICFSQPWTRAGLAAELENPAAVYTVAELDGITSGYAGMRRVLDECYVDNVAVFPRFRRKGIGRALMEYLIEMSRGNGARFLTLEVRPSNTGAKALYESLGFREAGRRKNFYSQPKEDALILTLFF